MFKNQNSGWVELMKGARKEKKEKAEQEKQDAIGHEFHVWLVSGNLSHPIYISWINNMA